MSETHLGSTTLDKVVDMMEVMSDQIEMGDKATRVIKGNHPEHGLIYIVIPAFGSPLLLPIEVQTTL